MSLLIYSTRAEGAGKQLLRVIGLLHPENKIEICRSIGELSKRLRQSFFNPAIAILLASSKEDFEDILSIRDLLWDTKIILIVPDNSPDTIAKGHTLRPRFLCDCNSDFVDLTAVLSRMIKNLGYDNSTDTNT